MVLGTTLSALVEWIPRSSTRCLEDVHGDEQPTKSPRVDAYLTAWCHPALAVDKPAPSGCGCLCRNLEGALMPRSDTAAMGQRRAGSVGRNSPRTLRVVTYNLQRGIHYPLLRKHFAQLESLRLADVVAVQEALVPAGGVNTLARLARDLAGDYRWAYRTVMAYPSKEYGNGFLFRSSVTPVAAQTVSLPQVDRLGWVARLKTEGGKPDSKSAFGQVFRVAGRLVRIVNIHLDFSGGVDHRIRQLSHLLRVLEPVSDSSTAVVDVLCGDFNTSGHYRSKQAWHETQQVLDVAKGDGFTECSAGIPWTSDLFSSIDKADPARRMLRLGRLLGLRYRQKLDHLLVRGAPMASPAAAVAATGHAHLPGSDHLPVAVELIL